MSLGKTIAQLRSRKGWTQAQLADQVAMTQAHINRLENDRMKPRPKTLERLAEALGVHLEDLVQSGESPLAADWARQDPELVSLFQDIASLPEADRAAVKRTLALIAKQSRIQQVIAS